MIIAILTVLGFLLGSIPFAVLIGKLFLNIDIRNYGDGNPGSTNLWKATNFGWGALAYIFDFLKGTIPAALGFFLFDIQDFGIVPVALAPIAGHAFSPLLRFRGGKAIAATYGVWAGLTVWEVPIFLAATTLLVSIFQKVHSWTQILVSLASLVFLLVRFQHEPYLYPFIGVWLGNFIIISIKHASELRCLPQGQPWMLKVRGKSH